MTLFWKLILWAGIIWLIPFLYAYFKSECKPKKNIIVGVTLPYNAQDDEAVLDLLEQYKKDLKLTGWIMLAAALPSLLLQGFGAFMTYWLTWTILMCLAFYVPCVRCNKAMRRLKEVRGWRWTEDVPQLVVDLKAAAEEMRWISPWWFLPPFVISLVPLFFDRMLWWLWVLDAAIVPLSYFCYRYLYRNRAEVVDENSERTIALTRIRRYNWGKFWLVMAWATGFFNIGLWLTLEHIWWCMAVILIYGLVVCAAAIGIEFRVRRLQEKLTADSGQGYYVDEDDRWIWGMIYYNPNDARLTINNRTGVGTTINLAKRSGQIIMGLGLALLLTCPLIGVWMIGMEHAPVELEVTETELVGSHYGGHWSVALEDIENVQLLEERPKLYRVAGTGMETALTGQFNSDEWGRMTICLDPRMGPWLLVEDFSGKLFLFGASEEGAVEEIAASLTAAGTPIQSTQSAP